MYETYTTIIILNELYILADIVLISSVFSKATILSWAHYTEELPI